ncbi:hypothetical protein CRUP_006946 [Coryphaenoides rupestris]|nr:hypothetical protein CRUP_006946 [Coryphaenoides rupestris]
MVKIRNSKASHLCMDQGLGRFTTEGQLYLGPLGSTGEDTRCVVDDQISRLPQMRTCDKVANVKQKTWLFSQVSDITSCLRM